jgi:hypothetical protein
LKQKEWRSKVVQHWTKKLAAIWSHIAYIVPSSRRTILHADLRRHPLNDILLSGASQKSSHIVYATDSSPDINAFRNYGSYFASQLARLTRHNMSRVIRDFILDRGHLATTKINLASYIAKAFSAIVPFILHICTKQMQHS